MQTAARAADYWVWPVLWLRHVGWQASCRIRGGAFGTSTAGSTATPRRGEERNLDFQTCSLPQWQSFKIACRTAHARGRFERLFEAALAVDNGRWLEEENGWLVVEEGELVFALQRHARAHAEDGHWTA